MGFAKILRKDEHFIFEMSARLAALKHGFHMIVPIVPVVSNNVRAIGTIIWKRYKDDRKQPSRLRRPRSHWIELSSIRTIGTIG